MGLYDRHYYGDSRGPRGFGGGGGGDVLRRIFEVLNSSFPIGTYLNVAVRVHFTWLLLVLFYLVPEVLKTGGDAMMVVRRIALLFLSVLLHEFGHCLGCRAVGGTANDILMWPLGGLAYCDPPRRPWPEFVTVICGPLVNVVLAAAAWLLLWGGFGYRAGFNPFQPALIGPGGAPPLALLLFSLFVVNYWLLLFNMALIFYPFDGGRLVQIGLWTKLGYARSLSLACSFGMVGAVIVALVALAPRRPGPTAEAHGPNVLLLLIAVFGFYTCYRQKQMLKYAADEDRYGLGLDAGYGTAPAPRGPGPVARWKRRRTEKQRQQETRERRDMERQVDRILDKIHREGIGSLSAKEKKLLEESSRKLES